MFSPERITFKITKIKVEVHILLFNYNKPVIKILFTSINISYIALQTVSLHLVKEYHWYNVNLIIQKLIK